MSGDSKTAVGISNTIADANGIDNNNRTGIINTGGDSSMNGLKRKTPMRRSRIKPVSAKKRAQGKDRRRCIEAVRERSKGFCEAGCSPACSKYGEHVHERLRRAQGGSITDADNCLHVCSACHRYIHERPAEAYALGLLIRRSA